METYLNKPEIKKRTYPYHTTVMRLRRSPHCQFCKVIELTRSELGAPEKIEFQSCNMQINQNFLLQGDGVRDTASLLPPLVEAGIRVLIYSGEADAREFYPLKCKRRGEGALDASGSGIR